jgi:Asp-tRNA(Asn)/Glu-tRNA(Gln) amidotransferase A subunit family amidase
MPGAVPGAARGSPRHGRHHAPADHAGRGSSPTDSEAALDSYRNRAINILCLSGLSGAPQITMPLATRLGAPLGISLLGPVGSDLSLSRIAARVAEAVGEPSSSEPVRHG